MERQTVYDMREETAAFLANVEVTEHPALASIPKEWALVPTEHDKVMEWASRK